MKCSDEVEVESVSCRGAAEEACGDFGSCGSKVMVPCKGSTNTVKYAKQTEWLWPEGHSFALRFCGRQTHSIALSLLLVNPLGCCNRRHTAYLDRHKIEPLVSETAQLLQLWMMV